jgi:uncharacterized protein YdcH (DUF465 family)
MVKELKYWNTRLEQIETRIDKIDNVIACLKANQCNRAQNKEWEKMELERAELSDELKDVRLEIKLIKEGEQQYEAA